MVTSSIAWIQPNTNFVFHTMKIRLIIMVGISPEILKLAMAFLGDELLAGYLHRLYRPNKPSLPFTQSKSDLKLLSSLAIKFFT